ncbi:hypothetical protein O181_100912, partial [Austropuccinia psidii MF-1]|nr:hypothetical protein [Austropuccinia psidii MF-1]
VESKQKANEINDGLLRGNNLNQTKETSNGLGDDQLFQYFDNEDPIPEISFSDQEENGSLVGSDNQVQEEEDDESKYPSDDVNDVELGSLLDDSTDDDNLPQELDALIACSSSKPIEVDSKITSDPVFILKKDTSFMSQARSKSSAFVQGVKINVWDDIKPGYGSESSTEEFAFKVFWNIPAHFYDDMPHICYDINGQKILRPAKGDELDKFLAGIEDPSSWKSVQDKPLQKDVKLTDKELEIIHKLSKAKNPDAKFNPYEPTVEFFTGKDKQRTMPLLGKPESKQSFIPSKWEHKKVMKIVRAIFQGFIVPNKPKVEKPQFYGFWSEEDWPRAMGPMYMPAPKLKLPGHIKSYNLPAEYLFDEDKSKAWEQADPSNQNIDFIPAKYPSLGPVPAYSDFVQQRFDRCLDLYLAPQMLRQRPKLDISDPSKLLPKLPSPKDLQPFPSVCELNTSTKMVLRSERCQLIPAKCGLPQDLMTAKFEYGSARLVVARSNGT